MCGQAMSHCLNYTLRDLIKHWSGDIGRIVLLVDGSSPVQGFNNAADEIIEYARERGVKLKLCEDAFKHED